MFLLNSLTEHYFGQFRVMLVVFLSDDELIFLFLFETMIYQACKYVLYGGPQLSHQIQITHIKYKILKSKTRLNGQRSDNENYVQFSLCLDPTAILFLHMVLSSECFAATAEEMSTIATFVANAGKVS